MFACLQTIAFSCATVVLVVTCTRVTCHAVEWKITSSVGHRHGQYLAEAHIAHGYLVWTLQARMRVSAAGGSAALVSLLRWDNKKE
jgi:hypothetical protein